MVVVVALRLGPGDLAVLLPQVRGLEGLRDDIVFRSALG
jgi:hypothetical protein